MNIEIRIFGKLDEETLKTLNLMIKELNEHGTALLSDKDIESLEKYGITTHAINDNKNAILEIYKNEHYMRLDKNKSYV